MRDIISILVLAFCCTVLVSLKAPSGAPVGYETMVPYFKVEARKFSETVMALKDAVVAIDTSDSVTITRARAELRLCWLSYKKIEFFLAYFFPGSAILYNGPPEVEVEEPFMEWETPTGLQVIESILYEPGSALMKQQLLEEVELISSSASDIQSLLYNFNTNDAGILQSIDVELIRIYTLGITGFDAPQLKSGIEESYAAMSGVDAVLQPYLGLASRSDSIKYYLAGSLQYLTDHNDFDTFNRLAFLTDYALPLQRSLRLLTRDLKLQLSTADSIVNNLSANLFTTDALRISAFGGKQDASKDMIGLGRKLFFETLLSGNNKISCATCHNPAKHFADGLVTSLAFNGHSNLKRNAPTLLYSAYQYEQFWDGRAKTLDEQIRSVLVNPDEMNGDETKMITSLEQDKDYKVLFNRAFPKAVKSKITTGEVGTAIAAFIQTLNPRNSAFDKYLQGDRTAMSGAQINGFNLFMGKAQCGTCHFAPLFNGLTPPAYNKTEIEVIGIPRTANFDKPQPDTDSGRYNSFPISFYQGAFKTPTIRNAAVTAPYMHNGSFSSLEQVLDFYNKGGGRGIGLNIGNQTLSPLPLNLTKQEIEHIIQFIESLTDTIELPI